MKGKPKSIETRERMSLAATARWARENQRRKNIKASSCDLVNNENERQAMIAVSSLEVLAEQPKAVSESYEVRQSEGEA